MEAEWEVHLREAALDDIFEIYSYLRDRIGHERAQAYASRIEEFCRSLRKFPARGRSRDDLQPGLRSATFESRAVIVYRIVDRSVDVLRVIHGAQDYGPESFQ
jgi:plasmid stabilization system protein ParE